MGAIGPEASDHVALLDTLAHDFTFLATLTRFMAWSTSPEVYT